MSFPAIPLPERLRPTLRLLRRVAVPLWALSQRELKARYAGTRLGTFWALLQPLATLGIYLAVFVLVLHGDRSGTQAREYALFILAGLLPFQTLADGLHRACGSLRQDKPLLEAANFPAAVIPLARVLSSAVPGLLGLLLLALACIAWGPAGGPGAALLALPLIWLGALVLGAGLALWTSLIAVFATDMAEFLGFALTALLFLTPIFYAADQLPPVLAGLLWANPLHHVVEAYRGVLLQAHLPWGHGLALLLWAGLSLGSGLWAFRRVLDAMRDEL